MKSRTESGMGAVTTPPRDYGNHGLSLGEQPGLPDAEAAGIGEELIGEVVEEFYRRARHDDQLGPVFVAHVHDWGAHLKRMNDFWSAALLRTGRYSGRPVERHRTVVGISEGHFDRWFERFEETVRDLCSPGQAEAFLVRARRMRDGMVFVLGLGPRPRTPQDATE